MRRLRIATRKSRMARAQCQSVIDALNREAGVEAEAVFVETAGDRDQLSNPSTLGGKGAAFVDAIRHQMREGRVDLAMHSLKDIPGNELTLGKAGDFVIAAHLERDDPRDCMVVAHGQEARLQRAELVIGTSSLRRAVFARRLYKGARIIPCRGAADTRVNKLDRGEIFSLPVSSAYSIDVADGVILAKAGLERIGLGGRISRIFSVDEMCPAVGQGVIVIECLRSNEAVRAICNRIDHSPTALVCRAEREMLRLLDGHCNSPIAGYCVLSENLLT